MLSATTMMMQVTTIRDIDDLWVPGDSLFHAFLKRVGEMGALQKGVLEECFLGSRHSPAMSIFKAQEG